MARSYTSDKSGVAIPEDEVKFLKVAIRVENNYADALEHTETWDLTASEIQNPALKSAWDTMVSQMRQAYIAFKTVVESP